MSDAIITAIITAVPTLIVAIASIVTNNSIISYKIDQLTKQVEKHNQVISRTNVLENKVCNIESEIKETKEDIKNIESHLYKEI